MATVETTSEPGGGGVYDPPLCDFGRCRQKKRGLHLATTEVLLDCGDTGYWCDYAVTYTNQHKARHEPEFVAEELKRFGQYQGIEDVMVETTTGMRSMLYIIAMGLEALSHPFCVRCREAVLISAAAPIDGRT